MTDAPGWPGIPPRWTSSAKSGVGTALSPVSRVWFTLSHGILDEIYYPRVDQACTRDFGMIVTGADGLFAEEKRDCTFEIAGLEDGVPAFKLINTHTGGRFRIIKDVLADESADVVIQRVRLEVLSGPPLRLFALLAPHLVNGGAHNTAWLGDYKGHRLLFAEGDGTCLALGCSRPFLAASVGFVGASDGWQMLHQSGWLTDEYDRAADGNVAMTAEIESPATEFRLALGFGRTPPEAAFRVRASLQTPFERQMEEYATRWRGWQARLRSLDRKVDGHNVYRVSTAVLRCHESPTFPGRPDRQPVDPLGRQQGRRRPGRLPSGLAARSGADRGRLPRLRRARRGAARRALPARGAGGRRQLAAELLAGRHALLARRPARRMRVPDAAAGHGVARGCDRPAGAAGVLADGRPRGRLRDLPRAAHRPGPLGGKFRLHAVHAGGADRGTAGRRRPRGGLRHRRRGGIPPRHRRCLERTDRGLVLCQRHAARA